jgi:hypothetical protein
MVKKLLLIGIAGFLGFAGLFAGLLVWAQGSGAKHQERFFAAVETGDARKVMTLFHPALQEAVDEPVLAAWIDRVRADLGSFEGLSAANFSTSTEMRSGAVFTESKGTVRFERGTAESKLVFADGKLVEFSVESPQIPSGWFQGPKSSGLYRQRGEEFLRLFLAGDADAAFAAMHPALQKAVPHEQLKEMIARVTSNAGQLKSVDFQTERLDAGELPTLRIFYAIECEDTQLSGEVDFQFEGMQGSILAFDIKPVS